MNQRWKTVTLRNEPNDPMTVNFALTPQDRTHADLIRCELIARKRKLNKPEVVDPLPGISFNDIEEPK
jgi:hypothetical protein